MDSIANEIEDHKAAQVRKAAFELQLPFALKELWWHAKQGEDQARKMYSATYSAKSGVEWPQHAKRCIYKAVAAGASEEEAKSGTRLPPEDERVREALETFTQPAEWKHLLKGCGYEEVRAFRSFLVANKGELEQGLEPDRYKGIYLCAFEHGLVLRLRGKVEVVDLWAPLRALRLWKENRELNRQGLSTFGKQRSTAEEAGQRGIATNLEAEAKEAGVKMYGGKIGKWLKIFEKEPYKDFHGDFTDYVLKKCYPEADERLRRQRGQREE